MNNQPIPIWRKHKMLHNLVGKKGKLFVWTQIFAAPEKFSHQTPYIVGLVEFSNGQKIPLEIVDTSEQQLTVGMEIETVIRRVGKAQPHDVITYGIKGKPIT